MRQTFGTSPTEQLSDSRDRGKAGTGFEIRWVRIKEALTDGVLHEEKCPFSVAQLCFGRPRTEFQCGHAGFSCDDAFFGLLQGPRRIL
jgi:hypothetical protein